MKRILPAALGAVTIAATSLALTATAGAATATAAASVTSTTAGDPPPVVDGTTQLGECDSLTAVSFTPDQTTSFVCMGDEDTDFGALRRAYKRGGMDAVQQLEAGAVTTASGPVQFTGLTNAKVDATHWNYSGTVIYGTVNSSGSITVYGKFSIQNKIALSGNYAKLDPFWAQRSTGGGSAMKFKLWFWFDITTSGGYWADTKRYCYQSTFSGDKLNCATSGLGYGLYSTDSSGNIVYYNGLGWYGRTKAQWWNQYSPNPSTSDGSWTLQVGHGPMDCKSRTQRCQWR